MKNKEIILSVENVEEIAVRLRNLLEGKKFSLISMNELYGFTPKEEKDKQMEKITTCKSEGEKTAAIHISCSDGLLDLPTSFHNGDANEIEGISIKFSDNYIIIDRFNGNGNKLFWIIIIQ
ncbi:MAG: hypothetical protein WCV41_03975 [Patescibacteria group bacterium]